MPTRSVATGKMADEMREIAERVSAERSAEWERGRARDRTAREYYLGKRAPGRAKAMYDHCLVLVRERAEAGERGLTEMWPDDRTILRAVVTVVRRLKEEHGFSAEWKPDTDTGRDGLGDRPVITMTIRW